MLLIRQFIYSSIYPSIDPSINHSEQDDRSVESHQGISQNPHDEATEDEELQYRQEAQQSDQAEEAEETLLEEL